MRCSKSPHHVSKFGSAMVNHVLVTCWPLFAKLDNRVRETRLTSAGRVPSETAPRMRRVPSENALYRKGAK